MFANHIPDLYLEYIPRYIYGLIYMDFYLEYIKNTYN